MIVSALLLADSASRRAFDQTRDRGEIILSEPLVEELDNVFNRSKFDRYVFKEERQQLLTALIRESTLIETVQQVQICRDPRDDVILETALNGSASCIITGDDDLLSLKTFHGIAIRTPSDFLNSLLD